MKNNILINLSKAFSIDTINLITEINNPKAKVLINQLLRSATSVGANIHEGNYASSKLDFINKFQIALKECYETEYWLQIFKETNILSESDYNNLYSQCNKIRHLLISSITTAKNNL